MEKGRRRGKKEEEKEDEEKEENKDTYVPVAIHGSSLICGVWGLLLGRMSADSSVLHLSPPSDSHSSFLFEVVQIRNAPP